MTDVDLAFASTDTVRVDDGDTVWFVQGLDAGAEAGVRRRLTAGEMDGAALCREHGDAAVVRLTGGDRPALDLWKAPFSSSELFWCIRPNGDVVVTDLLRNMLAAIPTDERAPSGLTLAAHYLYREPYPPLTLAANVSRIVGGRHVSIDPKAGTAESVQFDRVTSDVEERTDDEYLDLIEDALTGSMAGLDDDSTAILFSGGVDSTLLLSLKPHGLQPVSWVPDTTEFQAEVGYAQRAAALLGTSIEEVRVPEAAYMEHLEDAAKATGLPAYDDASPYFHVAYRESDHPTFVDGHGADSIFGPGLRLAKVASWLRFAPTRTPLSALAPRLSGHLGYRADQLASRATGIARDPWDPDGWAGHARMSGDPDVVGRITDPAFVGRLEELQLDVVRQAVENVGTTSDRFLAHVEIRHWVSTFVGMMHDDRQTAAAYGKTAVGPFVDWRVQRALATIPIERRYVVGLRSKWILKDILKRHVPDYPVDQRKKATALPWKRFYRDGPLTGFFDEYPVPDHIPASMRDEIVTNPTAATWSAISYAVWDEHVHRNTSLQQTAIVASESRTIA